MRLTKQQQVLEKVFKETDRPLTAQEAWQLARRQMPRLGQATVYRQLQTALERGILRLVQIPGKAARFEITGAHHRHFFVCRLCEILRPLKGCPGNMLALLPEGCLLESHEVILYGLCEICHGGKFSHLCKP